MLFANSAFYVILLQVTIQLFNEVTALGNINMLVVQLYLTLCNPMSYSLPGSSVHKILQARILEWIVIPFSRGSSQPSYQTHVSCTYTHTTFFTEECLEFLVQRFNKQLCRNTHFSKCHNLIICYPIKILIEAKFINM